MPKSLLILGGTGFIGKHVAKRAIKENYETYIFCRYIPKIQERIKGCIYVYCDLTNKENIKIINNYKFNYVINLSGDIIHNDFKNGGRSVIDVHLNALMNLLYIMPRDNLLGFVQIGSSDEYGESSAPQIENQMEKPFSSYSYAKFAASHFIKYLYREESFPGKVLRPFLIYGPGQDENRLIPYVIKKALNDEIIEVSSGNQLRDFLYIQDAVDAIFLALVNDNLNGEIINIGSGNPVKVKYIVEKIITYVGLGKAVYGTRKLRKGEIVDLYPNIELAKKILSWEPKISLDEGLNKLITFMRDID